MSKQTRKVIDAGGKPGEPGRVVTITPDDIERERTRPRFQVRHRVVDGGERYAMLRNGVVVNVIQWSGNTEDWQPPEGCAMVRSDEANIGDTYTGKSFQRAAPTPREKTREERLIEMLVSRGTLSRAEADELLQQP